MPCCLVSSSTWIYCMTVTRLCGRRFLRNTRTQMISLPTNWAVVRIGNHRNQKTQYSQRTELVQLCDFAIPAIPLNNYFFLHIHKLSVLISIWLLCQIEWAKKFTNMAATEFVILNQHIFFVPSHHKTSV